MLTHVHKCWDTLVSAHGSKGRSWGSFRAALSGRTRPVWGRTRLSWGTRLGNSFHLESGVFRPEWTLSRRALWVCDRWTPDASELASGANSSCRGVRCDTGHVRCVRPVWRPVLAQFAILPEFSSGRSWDHAVREKARVWCLVSVRGNRYFSNGQENRTLVSFIPDASSVNWDTSGVGAVSGFACQRLVEAWGFYLYALAGSCSRPWLSNLLIHLVSILPHFPLTLFKICSSKVRLGEILVAFA